VVSGIGRWELLFVFPLAFKGKHVNHRHVTMIRGSSIQVKPEKPLIMQCDGEIIQSGGRDFRIKKNGLRVL
jgi:diacylglycerol kinase family enzyme